MPFRRGHLQYFVAVAEESQMTRAAARLGIAQPALSSAIAQLEVEVGVALLERHARGVTLTEAGRAFLDKARAVVAAEQDALAMADELVRAASSCVEIGFVSTPPEATVPGLVAALRGAHPRADVKARELPFPYGTTSTWLEQVDAALCYSPTADPDVGIVRLWSEPRTLIVPAGHALAGRSSVAVADVLDEVWYGYGPPAEPGWAGYWRLDDHRGAPPERMTADRASNALELIATIATGQGVIALAASTARLIHSVLRNVELVDLADAAETDFSLSWRKDTRNLLVHDLAETATALGAAVRAAG